MPPSPLPPVAFAAPSSLRMHSTLPLTPLELQNLDGNDLTLVGFGSLLSETSSRATFPTLDRFRLGRVQGFRRVFRHPAAIFFERGMYVCVCTDAYAVRVRLKCIHPATRWGKLL